MSDKKLSTEDILAQIRGGGAPTPASDAAEDSPAPAPVEEAAPEAPAKASAPAPAASGPAPTSTTDIMAAIRGGGGGAAAGGAPPAAAEPAAAAAAAPAASGPAPSGTANILASIRGGGAGAPAAAPAAAAAKPKAAAPVDTAKAAGMSAAEMIKAARAGVARSNPETGAPEQPPKKVVLPAKPLKKKAGASDRREFLAGAIGVLLSPVVWAWGSLVAATTASGLAMARFMMPNVLVEPPTKFKIGPPTDYGAGTVSTKWKAQFGVWIVNDEIDGQQMIYALSTVCTHLGCTPNWLEGEQKFKCPCHGSGFYKTGINFEGPAPRPLERHGISLAADGMLEVDKSVKFQRELGQWDIAASFVPV